MSCMRMTSCGSIYLNQFWKRIQASSEANLRPFYLSESVTAFEIWQDQVDTCFRLSEGKRHKLLLKLQYLVPELELSVQNFILRIFGIPKLTYAEVDEFVLKPLFDKIRTQVIERSLLREDEHKPVSLYNRPLLTLKHSERNIKRLNERRPLIPVGWSKHVSKAGKYVCS